MTASYPQNDLAIEVQLTKSDLFRAVFLRAMRQPLFWFPVIAPSLVVLAQSPKQPYAWCIAAALSVGMLFFIPYRTSSATAKLPDVLAPITYSFSQDGVAAHYQNAKNEAAWSLVKGAREISGYIYVEMQRNSFHLIPKRLITDEQTIRLRAVLLAHLNKNAHLQQ